MDRLPPLNSLRVFETVAQSTNLDEASTRLHITNGAISRHIKQLEDWLNIPLFDRSRRSLQLTPRGKEYSEKISIALELVKQASISVCQEDNRKGIGISVTHSTATRLLSTKLSSFYTQHDINLSLYLDQNLNDFSSDKVDLAIRCGIPNNSEHLVFPLLKDRLIPVCHPDLLVSTTLPLSAEQISQYPLLHDRDLNIQWLKWFNLYGDPSSSYNLEAGLRYPSADVLINAVLDKQGIALVNEQFVRSELEKKWLVQVSDFDINLGYYFWLIVPKKSLKSQSVKTFCEWIFLNLDLVLDVNFFNKFK